MNKKKSQLINKYNSDFNEMFKIAIEISTCNRKKCKKEFEELVKYKEGVLSKISELQIKQSQSSDFSNHNEKVKLLSNEFDNKKSVKDYLEFFNNTEKKNVEPDKKLKKEYMKELKIFNRKLKNLLKDYHKTEIGKYYKKESEKLVKELSYNVKSIPLLKCSYKECVELHKKGLQTIKNLAQKLCDEKKKKSCKILKAINKIDYNNINLKQNIKLKKMIQKKGFI
jgi:hypothetical protein